MRPLVVCNRFSRLGGAIVRSGEVGLIDKHPRVLI